MSTNSAHIDVGQISLRAFSLSTLHSRTAQRSDPELVLAWTPLAEYTTHVITEGTVSEVRGRELHANLARWSASLRNLGAAVLGASFRPGVDEPASELYCFDERDIAALQEALAAPLSAAGVDPAAVPCALVWCRASPEAQLELVTARPYAEVSTEVEAGLLAAARRWYELRRPFFSGLFDLVVETDPDRYWRRDFAEAPIAHPAGDATVH